MIVKLKLINGNIEVFNTDKYVFSTLKELHPDICDATIYSDTGRKIHSIKRPFQFIYKHFLYKPLKTD